MLAGATAIEVGTGNFLNPMATVEIINGIWTYLDKKGISKVSDIIGGVNGKPVHHNPDH